MEKDKSMPLELFDLRGKIALVTGATRGLGEVTAMALAKAGADVAVCGRQPSDLARVSEKIKGLGRKSAGFVMDVTSADNIRDAVERILEHFGKVDILVNNAGINYRAALLDYREEHWDLVINTNLKGYFLVAQAVAPQMLERGYGKVINMSSIMGKWAFQNS
jgi:NAD(P)-dependent dehydrogenase (short-subunit alcohol dehydrogenase family)